MEEEEERKGVFTLPPPSRVTLWEEEE